MAITRVVSGLWGGKKAGSFAGKALSSGRPIHAAHDVISGLWGGKAHSSFAGKGSGVVLPRPEHAAHAVISGLWGGRAHGSFANKTLEIVADTSRGWIKKKRITVENDDKEVLMALKQILEYLGENYGIH